jgi:membrane associated rhomboid family serine protease
VIPLRDANPTRRFPIVTVGLIALCFVVFLYELTIQAEGGDAALTRFFLQWGVVPEKVTRTLAGHGDPIGVLGTLVSSMFLHAGWLHILGNMLYLWIFGNNVEDRLGPVLYLPFYLLGGVVAGLAQVAIAPTSDVPLVGASGGIAAVLGAYLVLYPRARVMTLVFLGFFYQLIDVPALIVLGFWFVLQLIDGIASLGAPNANDAGVAFFAHIGGFVMGLIVGYVARGLGPARRFEVG